MNTRDTLYPLLLVSCLATAPAAAGTVHVPGDEPTIQLGIDAAMAGDTVLVAAGTYTEAQKPIPAPHDLWNTSMLIMKPGVRLISESGPASTTLDAQGGRRVLFIADADNGTSVEGFTITGGIATGGFMESWGAGITVVDSEPLIRDNLVDSNSAELSGGIHLNSSDAALTDCTISNNTATVESGGVTCSFGSNPVVTNVTFAGNEAQTLIGGAFCIYGGSFATLVDCTFDGNSAPQGGVMHCDGAATFTGCTFKNNMATTGRGATVIVERTTTDVSFTDCNFEDNTAVTSGGGVLVNDTLGNSNTFTDCIFVGNACGADGGGASVSGDSPTTFTGCTFWENSAARGGGLYISGVSPLIAGCSFDENDGGSGGGIFCDNGASPTVDNTIIAFSTGGEAVACAGAEAPVLTCCDVFGNAGGDWTGCIAGQDLDYGNFSMDPSFCDAGVQELRLRGNSPCRPGKHPEGANCGLIGAWPWLCLDVGTIDEEERVVEKTTWGHLKSRFAK